MEQILNGSKFIKRIVRPPRIAFIINSLNDAEKFIRVASLSWGGRHFLAIPYDEKQGISDEWFDVIRKYNPDSIKSFCELAPGVAKRLQKSKFELNKTLSSAETEIENLRNLPSPGRIPEFFGQPIVNLMLIDEFYDTNTGRAKLCYVPSESNFDLYYKARYGVIDKDEWYRWQEVYIHPGHRKNHPSDLIDNASLNADKDLLPYIHQHRHNERFEEHESLIDYTATKLGHVFFDRLPGGRPKSETLNIIVVSKEEDIEDFCWYWAIRGQRFHPYDVYAKGPIWIDQRMITTNVNLLQDLFVNRSPVYVISKSVSGKDLPTLGNGWSFQSERLNEFYNAHYYVGDSADIAVNFVENETEYKFEVPESLKYLDFSHHQFAMLDIQIPGITLPKTKSFSTGKVFFANYWVTKSGLTRNILSNQNEITKLTIPTSWDVISTFANAGGYRLKLSDKGLVGAEMVRLIGGIENLWIISHPKIVDLFLEMSNVNKVNTIRKLIREGV
ncbi:MAG: hypothetical protein AB1798_21910, partial [Spirochaetota bacterium]